MPANLHVCNIDLVSAAEPNQLPIVFQFPGNDEWHIISRLDSNKHRVRKSAPNTFGKRTGPD